MLHFNSLHGIVIFGDQTHTTIAHLWLASIQQCGTKCGTFFCDGVKEKRNIFMAIFCDFAHCVSLSHTHTLSLYVLLITIGAFWLLVERNMVYKCDQRGQLYYIFCFYSQFRVYTHTHIHIQTQTQYTVTNECDDDDQKRGLVKLQETSTLLLEPFTAKPNAYLDGFIVGRWCAWNRMKMRIRMNMPRLGSTITITCHSTVVANAIVNVYFFSVSMVYYWVFERCKALHRAFHSLRHSHANFISHNSETCTQTYTHTETQTAQRKSNL